MRLAMCLTLVVLAGTSVARAAEKQPALARARSLYNAASYDAAIAAASQARLQRGSADAAALVLARAHLERYRASADRSDLISAREALQSITRGRLGPRDQVDLLVGIGQALFLADDFGAAAEVFESAITELAVLESAFGRPAPVKRAPGEPALGEPAPGELALRRDALRPTQARALLLDWWATALDREAQTRPPDRRPRLFDRIVGRMEQELREDPANPSANYWLVVAVRGVGDLDRAWDTAVAAWVRAPLGGQSASVARADLDRFVTQALVPERARLHPPRDQGQAATALLAEWDGIKRDWP